MAVVDSSRPHLRVRPKALIFIEWILRVVFSVGRCTGTFIGEKRRQNHVPYRVAAGKSGYYA